METNTTADRLRAADADRERIAVLIQAAGAEGRLTLDEVEDRLGAVYATKYTGELIGLTADLPVERPPRTEPGWRFPPRPVPRPLAAVALALAMLLIARWAVPYFWPIVPLFWLAMSMMAHARIRRARHRRTPVVPY